MTSRLSGIRLQTTLFTRKYTLRPLQSVQAAPETRTIDAHAAVEVHERATSCERRATSVECQARPTLVDAAIDHSSRSTNAECQTAPRGHDVGIQPNVSIFKVENAANAVYLGVCSGYERPTKQISYKYYKYIYKYNHHFLLQSTETGEL